MNLSKLARTSSGLLLWVSDSVLALKADTMPVPSSPAILGRLWISLSMDCTSMRCLRSGEAKKAKLADTAGVFSTAEMAGDAWCAEGEPGAGEPAVCELWEE